MGITPSITFPINSIYWSLSFLNIYSYRYLRSYKLPFLQAQPQANKFRNAFSAAQCVRLRIQRQNRLVSEMEHPTFKLHCHSSGDGGWRDRCKGAASEPVCSSPSETRACGPLAKESSAAQPTQSIEIELRRRQVMLSERYHSCCTCRVYRRR